MRTQKVFKYIIRLVIAVNLMIFMVVFLLNRQPKVVPLPNPNGYDDFLKAGALLTNAHYLTVGQLRQLSPSQLGQIVASNATAVAMLRVGLSHECRVSPRRAQNYGPIIPHINALSSALLAEAAWFESQKRFHDAADSYLDLIRFDQESCRGGDIGDYSRMQLTDIGALRACFENGKF